MAILINSTLLNGQVPFAGGCLGTTAYYILKTEGKTLDEAIALEEELFDEPLLGIPVSRTEFELISFISSHIGIRDVWLGVAVDVETVLRGSSVALFGQISVGFGDNSAFYFEEKDFFEYYNDFEFEINESNRVFEFSPTSSLFNTDVAYIYADSLDVFGAVTIVHPEISYYIDDRNVDNFVAREVFYEPLEPWETVESDVKVDGFFHKEEESALCLNVDDISTGDIFIVTPANPTSADAPNVCTGETQFSSITSTEELDALTEVLVFHRDIQNAQPFSRYLLNMNFDAQRAVVDPDTNIITNLEDIINLQPGLSSEGLNNFFNFSFDLLEGIETERISFVLEYHFGEVSLNIIPTREVDTRQIDGFLCRNTPLPGTFQDPSTFLFIGLGIFLTVIAVFALNKRPKRKKHIEQVDSKIDTLFHAIPIVDHGVMTIVQDDDQFSLYSAVPRMPQIEFESDLRSEFSSQTNYTHSEEKDHINYSKVKSVISKHTNYSQVSEMMLQLNDLSKIKGAARKKSFSQRVATILKESLSDEFNQTEDTLHKFDAEAKPVISLEFYLLRIIDGVNFWYEPSDVEDATIGIRSLLLALHFLRKMTEDLGFIKNSLNIHKTLSILVLLAAKFIEDKPFSNSYWASISGITPEEVSELEDLFCFSLGFEFSIDQDSLGVSLEPYEQFSL